MKWRKTIEMTHDDCIGSGRAFYGDSEARKFFNRRQLSELKSKRRGNIFWREGRDGEVAGLKPRMTWGNSLLWRGGHFPLLERGLDCAMISVSKDQRKNYERIHSCRVE